MANRTRNAKKNIFSGIINKLVSMLLPFIIRTVIIKCLGEDYLGLNSLFTSVLQVLNLAELGFSQAVIFTMYKPVAEGNKKMIYALLNMYKKIYRIIGIIVLVVGVALMPFLPHLIKGSYPNDINLYVLYFIYLFNTVISYWLFAYLNCILYANQKNAIVNNINTVVHIILNVTQIAVLLLFKNYYIFLVIMPICTIINNLWTAFAVRRLYPDLKTEGTLDTEIKQGIKKNVIGLGIQKVCATTRNSLDSIFASAFLGLAMTAIYNNYYMILSALSGIVYIIANSLGSSVGNSIAVDTVKKNYNDMMRFNFMYMWISGWTTICLFCLFQPFMKIWMGEERMLGMLPVILFCLYYYVLRMGDIRSIYNESAGLFWQTKVRAMAEALCNIVLNFIMTKLFGISGIIAATLISLFLCNFIWSSQITFKYYFKGISPIQYFLKNGLYFVVAVIAGVPTYLVTNVLIDGDGILFLVVRAVICMALPNIVFFLVYYFTNDYREMIVWLTARIPLLRKIRFLVPKTKGSAE